MNAKDNSDVPSAIKELTGGHGVDYAFEVVGVPALIQQAYLSLKRGGAVVCVGVVPMGQTVEIPGMMLSLEEKSLLGCLYGSANVRRDMPLPPRPLHAEAAQDRRARLAEGSSSRT